MDRSLASRLAHIGLLALLAGCVAVPRERAAGDIDKVLTARGAAPAAWQAAPGADAAENADVAELLGQPLTVERATQVAFIRNARIRETYATLGIAEADVLDAVRLGNPTFGYTDLSPREGGGSSQITRSVSLSVANILLLPARSRLARGEFERVRQSVTAALLELAVDVERAWYEHVSAKQVAEMRDAVATAGAASAEFAERSFTAGNLTPRDLALERAAASEARMQAARAAAEVMRARTALAAVLGISTRDAWDSPGKLAAPPAEESSQEALVDEALTARFDVAASRREVALFEDALSVTRRWRLLGDVDVGYERESKTDGARVHGPSLALQLPIFNQGQGQVLRAEAQLEAARARLTALELDVRNDVALGLDQLATTRAIAEAYRTALVPQREEVVRREMERYNFMLGGIFEVLQARRAEFDAYQGYLESVRDFWVACAELRRAVGGQRVCDDRGEPTIGVEDILEPRKEGMQHMDHGEMP
ncbi:MAG: TolC family protein [Steroidobacteraceae bacterium]